MYALVGALALAAPAFLPSTDALAFHANDAGNPYNHNRALLRRQITTDVSQATAHSWDFVIAGGGLAGLALASRLSEWNNQTVLVIEAGSDGSEVADQIDIPGYSYLRGLSGSAYDWNYTTVAQSGAGDFQKSWPRGKVLGGSGAINGMFWGRGDQEDYDAWGTLNGNNTNTTWNWNEVNKYIQKAENFAMPPAQTISDFHMVLDPNAHGSSGPIHTGLSQWIYPAVANWIPAWQSLGFTAKDLAGGSTHGVMISPSTINTQNQSRCDSKAGYIDPLPPRSNLMILTGQQVTKINFNGTDSSGNQVASGVSFAAASGAQSYTVTANKEVILCGGTIGSPQILQLSGIGPNSTLQSLGITVLKDLPVGYNLQDHVSSSLYYNTNAGVDTWGEFKGNADEQAAALTQWRDNSTGKWTYVNEAVGYISMADVSGSASAGASAAAAVDVNALVTQITNSYNLPANVQQGLTKQLNLQKQLLTSDIGQFEIILTMLGGGTTVGIQIALQHPFSRGTILINSADAFDQPTIDPSYLSTDIDNQLVAGALTFTRNLGQTADMKNFISSEITASDDDATLLTKYKAGAGTEFHPCGTCSMLPEEDGGVVDTNLVVYGTKNVRVVDSSIIPLQVSAHLMATTYGIAEKAADIIKDAHIYVAPPPVSSSSSSASHSSTAVASSSSSSSASASATADAESNRNSSSILTSGAKLGIGIGVGVGAAALLAAIIFFCCLKRKNKKRTNDAKGWYAGAAGGAADQGAWDTNAAYSEQGVAMGRPQRPFSTAGESVNTMATADLQTTPRGASPGLYADSGYQMGDYARGGASSPAPYQDYPTGHQGYQTGFEASGSPQHYGGTR